MLRSELGWPAFLLTYWTTTSRSDSDGPASQKLVVSSFQIGGIVALLNFALQ